jgi:hypothetical protein
MNGCALNFILSLLEKTDYYFPVVIFGVNDTILSCVYQRFVVICNFNLQGTNNAEEGDSIFLKHFNTYLPEYTTSLLTRPQSNLRLREIFKSQRVLVG